MIKASGVDYGKLTDAAIRRWLKGGVTRDYRSMQYPQLRLRASGDRSKASVFLVMNENNKSKWEKLGTVPGVCIKTLLDDLPILLAKRVLSGQVTSNYFANVGDLLAWYLTHVEGNSTLSTSWRSNCKSLIAKQLQPCVGSIRLIDMDFLSVDQQLVKPMLADGYAANYIRHAVNVLLRAFSAAADMRLMATNPLAGYRIQMSLKLGPAKATQLTDADLQQLFENLSSADKPAQMLFMLMLLFGTRINETRLSKWEQFAGDFWLIPGANVKNKQEHRLPLTPAAKSLLQAYQIWQMKYVGKRCYLFPSERAGKCISIRTAQYWSEKIRFKHFTSHALRKLCRTVLADMGVDTMVGERILNHALPVLLRTYVHSTLDKGMLNALEKYHQHLIARGGLNVG